MRFQISGWIASLAMVCGVAPCFADAPAATARIQFNRDIRPILSQNCFACHGPDKNKRKAELRFDLADGGAFVDHKGKLPVVAGNPGTSEVMERVTSKDPDKLMPPGDSGKKLTPGQIELLRKWIEQGAKWQPLWSFIPPERPEVPAVKDAAWCRNPIDRFILARLEAEGLKPSPEADKARLVRRLYLDLLGLPPTPAELDAALSDTNKDWYEKLVDRLLANPHYGERMALDWLDAARYADTHGYHIDSGRDMTRWREWVIDAFNQDEPFDKFTVEQLAGDLLPNATADQKIASGFSRNNMVNFEGGAIADEYHTAYVIDRVNTLGTVWLGLTVGCCQCHDHKFDPISQKEYYQLFAFFNHVSDNGLDGQHGNAAPFIATPTVGEKRKLDQIASDIEQTTHELLAPSQELDLAEQKWARDVPPEGAKVAWSILRHGSLKSAGGATFAVQDDGSILVSGVNPKSDSYTVTATTDLTKVTAIRLEELADEHLQGKGPGRSSNGNVVLTHLQVAAAAQSEHPRPTVVPLKTAFADFSQDGFPVSDLLAASPKSGWAIFPEVGKPHEAIFQFEKPLAARAGFAFRVILDFRSMFDQHQLGHFRLSVTDAPHPLGKVPGDIRKIVAIDPARRTDAQQAELHRFYRTNVATEMQGLVDRLTTLQKERDKLEAAQRTTMVMDEMAKPRETFILLRGQYDKHGDVVSAGVPRSLPPLPQGATNNRLGLAVWLVSPSHPLTARVAVNRYWQTFFGTGIVKTAEDFGSQGEEPSHPALLDWLACEFMNPSDGKMPKWDVKAMVRLIVTSATYRQSSAVSPDLLARDPENRLLAHGARMRLPAEFIRDQALAVSGLLNDEIGGRSVSPYQPPGLWEELMSRADGAKWTAQVYTQDHGKDLYRRTMYTFWKRTSPPPALSTFDAPDRETCTVRRSRTNTPLQALVLMNDPTYVEAARKLAERMMTAPANDANSRIAFAFRLAMSREPRAEESALLKKIHDQQLDVFAKDPAAGAKLLKVGESPADPKLDQNELAAWTTVASVILNLDETITKS